MGVIFHKHPAWCSFNGTLQHRQNKTKSQIDKHGCSDFSASIIISLLLDFFSSLSFLSCHSLASGETVSLVDVDISRRGANTPHPPTPPPPPRRSLSLLGIFLSTLSVSAVVSLSCSVNRHTHTHTHTQKQSDIIW